MLDFNHHCRYAQILSKTKNRSRLFTTFISSHFLWIRLLASHKFFAKALISLGIEGLLKMFAALEKMSPHRQKYCAILKTYPFSNMPPASFFCTIIVDKIVRKHEKILQVADFIRHKLTADLIGSPI